MEGSRSSVDVDIEGLATPTMNTQELDHYDFINAPQYVDFADLAQHDDPNADVFFETHREEDDFVISIENITPTVQLLTEQQNVLYTNQNEVNEAVGQAGMEDVKVVYYASPSNPQNKSNGRKTSSLNSTVGSFHTPVGDYEDCQDKENCSPPRPFPRKLSNTTKNSGSTLNVKTSEPVEARVEILAGGKQTEKDNQTIGENGGRKSEKLRNSLLSQLEKLTIMSSDEEDAAVESIEGSFYSPTGTPAKTDESLIDSLLKTPGTIKPKPSKIMAINSLKKDFFEGLSIESPMKLEHDHDGIKTEFDSNCDFAASCPNELLGSIEDLEQNPRKQSFIVKPSCGEEMVWNQDEGNSLVTPNNIADFLTSMSSEAAAFQDLSHRPLETEENDDADADNTLTSSFDSYKVGQVEEFMIEVQQSTSRGSKNRRASSCSDLTKLIMASNSKLIKKPLTHIPRMGLTIPHSPDASKRPVKKCRSSVKPSGFSNVGETPAWASGNPTGPSMPSKNRSFMPTVPYKGHTGVPARQPLKASHYVSLAEAISKFQKNTPERFRTLPKGRVPIKRSSSVEQVERRSPSPPPTQKYFIARQSRAGSVSSQVTTESADQPQNSRTNQGYGKSGASALQKKTTIPQPFKLSSAKPRATLDAKMEVTQFAFKARPVPAKLLQKGPTAPKDRPQSKVTHAIAPHFASDDRIRERNEKKAQSAAHSPNATIRPETASHRATGIRQSRIPASSFRTVPAEPPKPATVMKPFSFDQRNQDALRRKEEKIKQDLELETKGWEFHAHPLPSSFTPKLPKKKPPPLTNVEPFQLKSDQRGAAYQESLKQKYDEEHRRQRMMTTFYANPPSVLHKPAFEPEHPARAPLEPLDFQLNTEKRAVERESFDQYIKLKEFEEEEQRIKEQERLEELQRQEELEKRRLIVHKAQPFRHPKQFELKASEKALTVPQSPAFRPLPSQRRLTPTKNDNKNNPCNPRGTSSAEEVVLMLLFCTISYFIAFIERFLNGVRRLLRKDKK